MNAVTFVAYCGELAGLPRVDAMQRAHEVLYYVGLGEARYRNVETYSTGMKQRIKLAQALVHDPDLLFLDEPTNGMDPKGRDEMLELIRDLGAQQGRQPDPLVAPAARRRVHLRHVVVLDKGARGRRRARSTELKGPRRPRVRSAGEGRPRRRVRRRRCEPGHRVPRDRRGRHAGVRARRGSGAARPCSRSAAREGLQVAAPAAERADARGRVRPGGRESRLSADPRSGLPALQADARRARPRLAGHRRAPASRSLLGRRVPRAAARGLACRSSSARSRSTSSTSFAQAAFLAADARTFRAVPRAAGASSSSSSPSTSAPA